MKIPYNINNYLSVGDNKEELFNLIKQALREEYIENRKIYFCLRDCYQLKRNEELPRPHLYSDHEESDKTYCLFKIGRAKHTGSITFR